MIAEPIELRLPREAASGRRKAADARAVDEAFAYLGEAPKAPQAPRSFGPELTTLLREQLAVLESQRRELMRLLGE